MIIEVLASDEVKTFALVLEGQWLAVAWGFRCSRIEHGLNRIWGLKRRVVQINLA